MDGLHDFSSLVKYHDGLHDAQNGDEFFVSFLVYSLG